MAGMDWVRDLHPETVAWWMLYMAALEGLAYLLRTRVHGRLACILRGHWYNWETVYKDGVSGKQMVMCRRCRVKLWF